MMKKEIAVGIKVSEAVDDGEFNKNVIEIEEDSKEEQSHQAEEAEEEEESVQSNGTEIQEANDNSDEENTDEEEPVVQTRSSCIIQAAPYLIKEIEALGVTNLIFHTTVENCYHEAMGEIGELACVGAGIGSGF